MIVLLVMTCIKVNTMDFCSIKERHELSFRKQDVHMLEQFDYYPLPKADILSAAQAIYGTRDRAPHMPDLKEGCKFTLKEKEYYYESECRKLRSKLK